MPIPKIALSPVELELEEALFLQKTLQSGGYDQHIAFQLGNVIQKLNVRITIELEGMELIVLNAILNDLIAATTTSNDAVVRLADTQHKVQEQVARRYQEILAAQ
ncbi:MAG TPA: hypothetical protein VFU49_10825 [Ktedonobacteraceae bacterium]|nr:hypothetical protein [Ktedonobacteraceae bacterium]